MFEKLKDSKFFLASLVSIYVFSLHFNDWTRRKRGQNYKMR